MKNLVVKNMLNELLVKYRVSISSVATETGVSGRTINKILSNSIKPSIKTERKLINFYCFCLNDAIYSVQK